VCVELDELVNLGLDLLASGGVVPEVSGLTEEFGAETLVRVNENSVLVAVGGSGGVLAQQGHVPDQVAVLGALGSGDLLAGLVVNAAHVLNGALNLDNVEASAEGVAGKGTILVEQVVKGGVLESSPLLVDVGQDDGVGGHSLLKLSGVGLLVVVHLSSEVLSELGGAYEGHDVGVVLEVNNLLAGRGLIDEGTADVDHLTGTQVGELELKGQNVPVVTGSVSDLKFVGELVHLEDVDDLGDNIEVLILRSSVLHGSESLGVKAIELREVVDNPLSEGGKEGGLVFLESGTLAGVVSGSVL